MNIEKQYQLWESILGTNKRKKFHNVFYNDKNPDCFLRKVGDKILLFDFGNKDYFGLNIESAYFKKFRKELPFHNNEPLVKKILLEVSFPLIPNVIEWNNLGLSYWGKFGIDITRYPFVKQISGYSFKEYFPVTLGFLYQYTLEKKNFKIYLPFIKPKFLGNISGNTTIYLGTQGPLICCKSLKDQLFLDSHFQVRTYHVQSENTTMKPKESPDFIFFDNDDDGIAGAAKYSAIHGGKPIFLKKAKDITDHYLYYGLEDTVNCFLDLIHYGK